MTEQHLSEKQMHPGFVESEQKFHESAGALWTEVREVQERIRSKVELSEEEREDEFIEAYHGRILPRYEELANTLIGETVDKLQKAYNRVYVEGVGADFAAHLVDLAGIPDEKLEEIASVAKRTGQKDLHRAVAVTSLERQGYSPLFEAWSQAEPQAAEALKLLRSTPGGEQLRTRVGALKPPRVAQGELQPSPEMREKAAEEERLARAKRRGFFQGERDSGPQRRTDRFGNTFLGR